MSTSTRHAFAIITVLFFMWGFITVLVDALIPRLRDVFELSYFQAGLVQFAFFTAYAMVSIPSGYLISRIGYQKGAVVGLSVMALGCLLFYPAAAFRIFEWFLLALFVLASGMTVLQVAANPYVAALGDPHRAASRLNLAQAFNSLGTTLAPLVSAAFILSSQVLDAEAIAALGGDAKEAYFAAEAVAVQQPFAILAAVLILVAGVFAWVRLPRILETTTDRSGSYRAAWSHRSLRLGAIGIFVYVGAEVTIGSYLVNYFLHLDIRALVLRSEGMATIARFLAGNGVSELGPAQLAGTFVFFYWGGAMVGRFIGSWLQTWIHPARLLAVFASVNVALLGVNLISGGWLAVWSVLAIGLFNSILFPTIFTLAIQHLGPHAAQGSGILCTAIVGGAVVPPLYGALADATGLQTAFLLPLLCYLFIAYYGIGGYHDRIQPES